MKTYSSLVVSGLAAIIVPTLALAWLLRPRPFKYVLRGGEAAVCLAAAIFASRSLLLIAASPVGLPYPGQLWILSGDLWAVVSICLLSTVAMLMWSRLAQVTRHRMRNREAALRSITDLEAHGVDVTDLRNKLKGHK